MLSVTVLVVAETICRPDICVDVFEECVDARVSKTSRS